jgi:hypothetical protein
MITADDYKDYFGVSTAPTNLDRLEFISLEEIKSIMTCDIPTSTDENYDTFLKALMEQINYFDLNNDLISYSQLGGASLGKFNEGGTIDNTIANKPKISPMAYKILLNLGYLYAGMC